MGHLGGGCQGFSKSSSVQIYKLDHTPRKAYRDLGQLPHVFTKQINEFKIPLNWQKQKRVVGCYIFIVNVRENTKMVIGGIWAR